MSEPNYAVIAYIPGRLGQFIDEQRDRWNPDYATALAHVTLLTPRPLIFPQDELVESLRKRCTYREPFDVTVEGVGSFWPANGVVYLSLSQGFSEILELHRMLNVSDLRHSEPFPFIPHITIAQGMDEARTQAVLAAVSREWSVYDGEKSFRVETLCLVQQASAHAWLNLAAIPLSSFYYAARP
jgi:2'-5' RNA ligase